MAHTYAELKGKTVAQLREIAAGIDHEAVKGHTQMNKEHLLEAICRALNIDMHEHHEVVGVDKAAIKTRIRAMKKKRDEALAAHDAPKVRDTRQEIHKLKRQLRKATV
jgi:hypothetical protein